MGYVWYTGYMGYMVYMGYVGYMHFALQTLHKGGEVHALLNTMQENSYKNSWKEYMGYIRRPSLVEGNRLRDYMTVLQQQEAVGT